MPHVDEGLLHAYLDGELTPVERARVDEHLAGCLACRTRLDEERQLIERASTLLGLATPSDRPSPPLSALARPRPRRFWHVRMPLAWAATVILAIGLGWKLSEQLGGPETKTMATPAPTATGRPDIRRQRSDKPAPPTLAQKPAPRRDTFTDELRSVTPAEERDAAGAGSVAAPAPVAPAANAATRNPEVRLQAVTVGAAPAPLDSAGARAILGREPLTIPGLPVRRVTRSSRWPDEVIVEQSLDSSQVIMLWERPVLPAEREAAPTATRGTTVAKAAPDYVGVGRMVHGVWVQITGGVKTDSLQQLLGKIKP